MYECHEGNSFFVSLVPPNRGTRKDEVKKKMDKKPKILYLEENEVLFAARILAEETANTITYSWGWIIRDDWFGEPN